MILVNKTNQSKIHGILANAQIGILILNSLNRVHHINFNKIFCYHKINERKHNTCYWPVISVTNLGVIFILKKNIFHNENNKVIHNKKRNTRDKSGDKK